MSLPHEPHRPDELWQPGPIRTLIADDSDLYSEALALTLQFETGIEIVGRAADGREAVELALSLRPDVILMDLDMPVLDGIEATKAVLRELPSTRIVVVTGSSAAEDKRRAENAGVAAYVHKGGFAGDLFDAIYGSKERSGSGRSAQREARPEPPPARPPRRRAGATMRALRAFR